MKLFPKLWPVARRKLVMIISEANHITTNDAAHDEPNDPTTYMRWQRTNSTLLLEGHKGHRYCTKKRVWKRVHRQE